MKTAPNATAQKYRLESPADLPEGPLHVFGYGSLLWRPGFTFEDSNRARLYGFHRSLRVWSWHHRGHPERPGLVLGLDRGGCCDGCVFRVPEHDKDTVARYLWDREMVTSVYIPRLVCVHSADGAPLNALTFVLDRSHDQYAGQLSAAEAARHVAGAEGKSGANPDYIIGTVEGLESIGIEDHYLRTVMNLVSVERMGPNQESR